MLNFSVKENEDVQFVTATPLQVRYNVFNSIF
jgi:hypothetical protein